MFKIKDGEPPEQPEEEELPPKEPGALTKEELRRRITDLGTKIRWMKRERNICRINKKIYLPLYKYMKDRGMDHMIDPFNERVEFERMEELVEYYRDLVSGFNEKIAECIQEQSQYLQEL